MRAERDHLRRLAFDMEVKVAAQID